MTSDAMISEEVWNRYLAVEVDVTENSPEGVPHTWKGPLWKQLHDLCGGLMLALPRDDGWRGSPPSSYGINFKQWPNVKPLEFKAMYRAMRMVCASLERYSPNSWPTVEQTRLAFSCAYNLYDESIPEGATRRRQIREAAEVLGVGELGGPECMSDPQTIAFLQFAKPETVEASR